MTSIMYIVKLAKRGTEIADAAKWKYVSSITIENGEITEFEFSPLRSDAKEFSRFTAQDICKAMPEKFYAYREKTVLVHFEQTEKMVAGDPLAGLTIFPDGIEKRYTVKAPKGCRAARFCKLTFNRRSVILQSIAVSDKAVSGVTLDGEATTIFLRKGIRVQPLGTSCDGILVPMKLACTCNNGAALAVEHGRNW